MIQVHSTSLVAARASDRWPTFAAILITGYLGMGKSFAYLGIPWISLFIGEMALGAFLVFGPRVRRGTWLDLVQHVQRLKRLKWLTLLFLLYGASQALRGMARGYPAFTALRDTAFNYYPLFLFLGLCVGLRDSRFLSRVVRMLALWAGCYGLAWVLFLSRIPWTMPGTDGRVLLFMIPQGASTVALLGLLASGSKLKEVWTLALLNVCVVLGVQGRSEWLGLAVGVLAFAWMTRMIRRLVLAGAFLIGLLGLIYVTGISLNSAAGRGEAIGGTISANSLVARAIAPVNEGLARDLGPDEDVSFAAGTAAWRLVWWKNIWDEVHSRLSTEVLGFGYGYPIGDLNPDIEPGTFIQTPHNAFFYALAYSGWFGVLLFALLQLEMFKLLLQSYRITGQPFGLMCWAALVTISLFGDFFEAPFGAIPFYLLVGAAIAPAFITPRRTSVVGRDVPLPGRPTAPLA